MKPMRKCGLSLLVLVSILTVFLFCQHGSPFKQNLLLSLQTPSEEHILGTDHLGRDLGARLARGTVNSVLLSGICVSLSLAIGFVLGMLAAWRGGKTEKILLLATDTVMAFPGIVLAIVLSSLTGGGPKAVVMALVFTGWPNYFRMSRTLLRGLLESPFVESAYLAGFPALAVICKYIVPEVASTLGVMVSIELGKTILDISSLGFLGIGLMPPEPELGAMISDGLSYMRSAPGVVLFPGGIISALVLAFLLLGGRRTGDSGGYEP